MYRPFLQAVVDEGYRLTYAGLSHVYRLVNGDEPIVLKNAGQHGAGVVKEHLVGEWIHLQPYVCRADGDYDAEAWGSWSEAGLDVPQDLGVRRVIPAKNAIAAFNHWAGDQ